MSLAPFVPTRPRLIQNALYIPEKDLYLKSGNLHDYVSVMLDDGTEVMTDGGTFYLHRTVNDPKRVIAWDIYDNDPFEIVAARFLWGTYGPERKGPFRWVPLKDCSLDHLRAIRDTQTHIRGKLAERVVLYWIAAKEAAL